MLMSNEFILQLRKRKKWQMANLQQQSKRQENILTTFSRIEKKQQKPKNKTLDILLETLELPRETFFYPYMDEQSADSLLTREQLVYYLDIAEQDPSAIPPAEEKLTALSATTGDGILARQFLLCTRARLAYLQKDYPAALQYAREGINLTFPEFSEDDFNGQMVLPDESELVHNIARARAALGETAAAINILENLREGAGKLPTNDNTMADSLIRALRTLIRLLIETKQYEKALPIFDEAIYLVNLWYAREAPDFGRDKAECLFHLDRREECIRYVHFAYHGYALLNMHHKRDEMKRIALERYGIEVETYGAEKLPPVASLSDLAPKVLSRGQVSGVSTVGGVLRYFRKAEKLPPKEVYKGLCTQSYYSKIENGTAKRIDPLLIEMLFARLGREYYRYFMPFYDSDYYTLESLRQDLATQVSIVTDNDRDEKLAILSKHKSSQSGLGRQFYLMLRCAAYSIDKNNDAMLEPILLEGLRITLPDFDESEIAGYRMTRYEHIFCQMLGQLYARRNEIDRANNLFKQMMDSLNFSYRDERRKAYNYTIPLLNYSYNMIRQQRHDEAYPLFYEGMRLCITYGITTKLYQFAHNLAYCFSNHGNDEKALPWMAMSMYYTGLLNHPSYKNIHASTERGFKMKFVY
jgi:transcriptional regulator with XRE-family HTH domain